MEKHVVITICKTVWKRRKNHSCDAGKKTGYQLLQQPDPYVWRQKTAGSMKNCFGMSDEKLRQAPWFKTLSRPYDGELACSGRQRIYIKDDNLFNYQAKIIKELAEKESCVIIGRCADYILRGS